MSEVKADVRKDLQFIQNAFLHYVAENEEYPSNVKELCSFAEIDAADFYMYFDTIKDLSRNTWYSFGKQTRHILESDPEYLHFSSREKLLAFYYTMLEVLQEHKSFVKLEFTSLNNFFGKNYSLQTFRESFRDYCSNLIRNGVDTGEIADRKFISDQYLHGFWIQLLFVLRFWVSDKSPGNETTDSAIEKAVNLSFDLIARGSLDSFFDFSKFAFQNRNHFCK